MVGSHCAEYYAKKGAKVIVLDNLMRSELFKAKKKSVEYNWRYLANFKNIKRIKGDVRNKKDVLLAIGKGVDAVIHTAGQPGVPSSVQMPREDFSINAFGTLNVLECLRQRCKKAAFVYCSTNKVYGENIDKIPLQKLKTRYTFKGISGIDEQMPTDLTGHTPYGVSKLVGDLYTQEYAHIYGMKTAVFRMSCLSKNSYISTPQGNIKIKDIKNIKSSVFCINGAEFELKKTKGSFQTNNKDKVLYRVETKRGYCLEATGDHKFYTPAGYRELDKIAYGSLVGVCPLFHYVQKKHVISFPNKVIIDENRFMHQLQKYRRCVDSNLNYLKFMKDRELLPLKYDNQHIYTLASLVGYLTGDGHLYFKIRPNGKSYTEIQVYALKEEIADIRKSFINLGFNPGRVRSSYSRSVLSDGRIIEGKSFKFSLTSTEVFALFELLGVPVGHKSKLRFEIPKWLRAGPEDLLYEYLRGLFGAEMSTPTFYKRKGESGNELQPLIFSQSKNVELTANAFKFRKQIVDLLKKKNIEIKTFQSKFLYKKGGDKSICFQFIVKPSKENFLKFAQIGYSHNKKRQQKLYKIVEFLKTDLPFSFFESWEKEHTYLLNNADLVWDRIIEKKKIPMQDIYDITVPVYHNFFANGFLVHNCIYGERQFGFEDQGWVAWFIIACLLGKKITIYGDGKQVRDMLYAGDLAIAFDKFIRNKVRHAVFNIGGGKDNTISLLEFLEQLPALSGRQPRLEFSTWRPSDQKVYITNIAKVKQVLAWQPKIDTAAGLDRLSKWVKGNKTVF